MGRSCNNEKRCKAHQSIISRTLSVSPTPRSFSERKAKMGTSTPALFRFGSVRTLSYCLIESKNASEPDTIEERIQEPEVRSQESGVRRHNMEDRREKSEGLQ